MADSNASRFLITGASGNQGNAVAHQLLSIGHNVNAFIRDTTKPAAQALQSKGATIIQGDYDNHIALSAAAQNCQGVFLLTVPGPDEVQHALNILTAAKQAGISTVVCSTVARAEEYKSFPNFDPNGVLAAYWRSKAAIQEKIVAAEFRYWTILQPAWLMTNLIAPVSRWYWPELSGKDGDHVLLAACAPETIFHVTAPEDVGVFAVPALTDPSNEKWHRKIIRIASEGKNIDEIANIMSRISNRKIIARYRSNDEIQRLLDKNPFVSSQVWQRDSGTMVDCAEVKRYGMPLTSLEEFLSKHREAFEYGLG